jgi:malonate decarboxylase epsilon subunit
MRIALLFPGQGAQRPGFLERLPQHAAARATLAEARQILGHDPGELDTAAALESTTAVQLGTVIAGVATARAVLAEGVTAHAVAGLSVGAFAAAVTCAALSFADALRLVRLRGESMARSAPHGHGMAAILGVTERDAQQLLARVNERRPLYLASVNSPTEVVVAGEDAALELLAQEAGTRGVPVRRLRVSIPSHCPLMDPVSMQLRAALGHIPVARPRIPYVSNHRARLACTGTEVAEDLVLNVARTVRWHDSMTLLYELGCRLFLEMPPGQVLSGLLRSSLPDVRALALEEVPLRTAVTLALRAPSP